MNDPTQLNSVPLLDGENWKNWFFRMENHLRLNGLWEVTRSEPTMEEKERDKSILEKMDSARVRLLQCIQIDYVDNVVTCETPHQVWTTMKQMYEETGYVRERALKSELSKFKKIPEESIEQYLNRLVQIANGLRNIGVTISEKEKVTIALNSLPAEYNTLTTMLDLVGEVKSFADIRRILVREEAKLSINMSYFTANHQATAQATPAVHAQKQKTKCQYCQKIGHEVDTCRNIMRDFGIEGPVVPSKYKSKTKSKPKNQGMQKLMAAVTSHQPTETNGGWIIDSGASWHITGNKDILEVSTIKKKEVQVEITDGSILTSQLMGNAELTLTNSPNTKLILQNVLYIPQASANLISVKDLCRRGMTVTFTPNGCKIQKGKIKLNVSTKHGNYYCLQATAKIWHQRLGHVNAARIRKLNLPYKVNEPCEACITCKQTAAKHQPKQYTLQSLDLVYLDVMGPISPETPAGFTHILSVLDHSTKFGMTYLMTSKGEAGKYTKQALTSLEKLSGGTKVKAIRTDRGQEFLGSDLKTFLDERGIVHELTAGYSPEQNDAERFNRDIRDHASTMLANSKLPAKYWGEAVRNYSYTRNKLPASNGTDEQTPFEKLTGRKPILKNLRVFGCECWVLRPKHKIISKFEPRSTSGILLGYENSTTYRVLAGNNLVISRNVRFNEQKMGDYVPTIHEKRTFGELVSYQHQPIQWENTSTELADMGTNDTHSAPSEDQSEQSAEPTPEPASNNQIMETDQNNGQRYNLRPNRRTDYTAFLTKDLPDKFDGYNQAMSRPDSEQWQEAIKTELNSLSQMRTWTFAELPKGKKALGTKWVFNIKRDGQNNILKYKARLVALGCHQRPGEDYDEIYASVVSKNALRLFLAAVNQLNLHLHQLDVETAFLNAELGEEVYLRIPSGLTNNKESAQVLKLNRSLYGLKQAPRAWNQELTKTLNQIGFKCNQLDQSVLKCTSTETVIYMCFYVDDILIAGTDLSCIQTMKDLIQTKYKITDLNEAKHFLGMTIIRDRTAGTMILHQANKVSDYIQQHGIETSKIQSIPLNVPLLDDPLEESVEHLQYQKICGQLQYLSGTTRPDICYAASALARYNANPKKSHWNALRGTLKYLHGTENKTLVFQATDENVTKHITVNAYSDADYAGEKSSRRSRTGYVIQTMGSLVAWQSKMQPTIAISTTEAEYQAATATVKEVLWIKNYLKELLTPKEISAKIKMDNQSALRLLLNPQSVTRAKHIDVQHHFLRERAVRDEVQFEYCPTDQMIADYLTKQVPVQKFKTCIYAIGMREPSDAELSGSVETNVNSFRVNSSPSKTKSFDLGTGTTDSSPCGLSTT